MLKGPEKAWNSSFPESSYHSLIISHLFKTPLRQYTDSIAALSVFHSSSHSSLTNHYHFIVIPYLQHHSLYEHSITILYTILEVMDISWQSSHPSTSFSLLRLAHFILSSIVFNHHSPTVFLFFLMPFEFSMA